MIQEQLDERGIAEVCGHTERGTISLIPRIRVRARVEQHPDHRVVGQERRDHQGRCALRICLVDRRAGT
jgi:hypothetical protein